MTGIEIKKLESNDIGVEWWLPELHEDVYFEVRIDVGEVGSSASDSFTVRIATPEGLRKHGSSKVLAERATIIVADYSPSLLKETLERIVKSCLGHSWTQSVDKLNRYFRWQHEDSRETGIG